MYDVTFLIPDYSDLDEDFTPPPPEEQMSSLEEQRLFEELCALADNGAFDDYPF